ncbi:MAG TPA: hypothetical protein H9713_01865 [Candidatus Mediterraneibacter surreyensis]|nr:hypothetical protein [Candidatus Mediterraneibacter surreyensis]
MQFLNRDFYNTNIISYIDVSMQTMLNGNQDILNTKEYLLFYYIKENFVSNFYSLYNTDIDLDCFGFSVIQRNTRHSIESYLDLINLVSDSDYLTVMQYCAHKGKYDEKYKSYLKENIFNIPAKYNIATKMYGKNIPKTLLKVASDSNKHTHPNTFIEIMNMNECNKKADILRKLLNTNLFILTESYKLIVQNFNNGFFPTLNCQNCVPFWGRNCSGCFENERIRFQNLIDNGLVTYTNPVQATYQQPPIIN